MNVLLWILQGLLAFHTVAGAVWKLTNGPEAVPSLSAIPHTMWLSLSVLEILAAIGLLLPAMSKRFAKTPVFAAGFIATVMIAYCVLHLMSGDSNHGQMIYWLVVAVLCGFIAFGRAKLKPQA